jgi:hypothetical protein
LLPLVALWSSSWWLVDSQVLLLAEVALVARW